MNTSHALIAFLVASGLLTITLGLETMLVLRTAASGGRQRATAAGLGICLGLLTWGVATSLGLSALLSASRLAYSTLRIAGACCLVFLAGKLFRRRDSRFLPNADFDSRRTGNSADTDHPRRWFIRGALTNLLNPKVGFFDVTFLPRFIPSGSNVAASSMLLASMHAVEGILWFALLITAVRRLSGWLGKRQVARTLDRLTGAVCVGFGLRLFFADRR